MSEDRTHGSLSPPNGEDGDGELVRRIQTYLERLRQHEDPQPANRDEWDRLYRLQSLIFWRLVRRHRWPAGDCEDCIQELWLWLISRLPNLQFEPFRGDLRDWIAAIAAHRLADQERYRRSHSIERLASEVSDQLAGREPDPVATAERKQVTELVREALAELRTQVSQRDYDAFTPRWLGESSVQEVANRLGTTEAQVWAIHNRLRRKLRPLLARRLLPEARNNP